MPTDIENVQQLIEAAQKEGFQVNESEAETILIRDAILFAGEMCADLVERGDNSAERQAQYEEDEKILGPLYEAALNWRG